MPCEKLDSAHAAIQLLRQHIAAEPHIVVVHIALVAHATAPHWRYNKTKKNPTCDITLAHANSTTLVQNKKSAKSIGIALNHNVCPNMTASAIYRPGYPPHPPRVWKIGILKRKHHCTCRDLRVEELEHFFLSLGAHCDAVVKSK